MILVKNHPDTHLVICVFRFIVNDDITVLLLNTQELLGFVSPKLAAHQSGSLIEYLLSHSSFEFRVTILGVFRQVAFTQTL